MNSHPIGGCAHNTASGRDDGSRCDQELDSWDSGGMFLR